MLPLDAACFRQRWCFISFSWLLRDDDCWLIADIYLYAISLIAAMFRRFRAATSCHIFQGFFIFHCCLLRWLHVAIFFAAFTRQFRLKAFDADIDDIDITYFRLVFAAIFLLLMSLFRWWGLFTPAAMPLFHFAMPLYLFSAAPLSLSLLCSHYYFITMPWLFVLLPPLLLLFDYWYYWYCLLIFATMLITSLLMAPLMLFAIILMTCFHYAIIISCQLMSFSPRWLLSFLLHLYWLLFAWYDAYFLLMLFSRHCIFMLHYCFSYAAYCHIRLHYYISFADIFDFSMLPGRGCHYAFRFYFSLLLPRYFCCLAEAIFSLFSFTPFSAPWCAVFLLLAAPLPPPLIFRPPWYCRRYWCRRRYHATLMMASSLFSFRFSSLTRRCFLLIFSFFLMYWFSEAYIDRYLILMSAIWLIFVICHW